MKLGWLGIPWDADDDTPPVFCFKEPDEYTYAKVIPIVYAELEE